MNLGYSPRIKQIIREEMGLSMKKSKAKILNRKLFIIPFLIGTMISMYLMYGILDGWLESNRLHIKEDALNLGRIYAMDIEESMIEKDGLLEEAEMAALLDGIEENYAIDFARFIGRDYRIIASTDPIEIGQFVANEDYIDLLPSTEEKIDEKGSKDKKIEVLIPVFLDEARVGTLVLGKKGVFFLSMEQRLILGTMGILISIILGLIIFGRVMYVESRKNLTRAYYDKLTNLPNDTFMKGYLKDRIEEKQPKRDAIFLINIQNFRTINMALGFEIGDQIIKDVAKRLEEILINQGIIFRFTGGRFLFYLEEYKDHDHLLTICDDIIAGFEKSFCYLSQSKQIQPEIGIVKIDGQYTSVDSLIKDAAITLSFINKNTKCVKFFDQEMRNQIDRKEMVELELIRIVNQPDQDILCLVYQPKINLKTNEIMGFEALARIDSKKLGVITPVEFIEVAEDKQLIIPLGTLVLETACIFLSKLIDDGFSEIKMAVNVSGTQILQGDFIKTVKEIIEKTGISTKNLELEITETVLLDNYKKINGQLQILRDMGIEISMDDFGTGFSSLASIGELNIDTVKIDQYFIKQIVTGQEENIITTDIIAMAHKLGLKVVAEGIETKIQKKYLMDHGCDIMQGFHFSLPLSEEKAKAILV